MVKFVQPPELKTDKPAVANSRGLKEDFSLDIGQRNDTLFKEASSLISRGFNKEKVELIIHSINTAQGNPPLPKDEVQALIDSAYSRYNVRLMETYEPPAPKLDKNALQGLAGEIVKAFRPYTETSDIALLMNLFTMYGSIIGRGSWIVAESQRHHPNIFSLIIGATAKSRKTTATHQIKNLINHIDETYLMDEHRNVWRTWSGLSTAEGMANKVRDVDNDDPPNDKRLCSIESEFSTIFNRSHNTGNTLDAVLRQAWDGDDLMTMTRNNSIEASEPHISIVGNITGDEMLKLTPQVAMANGFLNRFLIIHTDRARLIPRPKSLNADIIRSFTPPLIKSINHGINAGELDFDESTNQLWAQMYPDITKPVDGFVGHMMARSEPQIMRLALIYALLDEATEIGKDHLLGALAIWEYCMGSIRKVFGNVSGDTEKVLEIIMGHPQGITRTELSGARGLNRNLNRQQLNRAIAELEGLKMISVVPVPNDKTKPTTMYIPRTPTKLRI